MEKQPIVIACEGATNVPLDELIDLQGNLKDLSDENYLKLKRSMLEYGFSFPVFMWQDNEGKKWILDAHQRIRTLRKMRSEGHVVPLLPADYIHAKDKTEAKKKLLLLNSRYGKIDREGYDEFIDEPGAEINEEEMAELLVIPEVQLWNPITPNPTEEEPLKSPRNSEVICPNCQHVFDPFDKDKLNNQ